MFIRYQKLSDTDALVTFIHWQPSMLPSEMIADGIIVEGNLPQAEEIAQKDAVLHINPQTHELWYEYVDRELTPEELLEQRIKAMEDAILALMLGGAN